MPLSVDSASDPFRGATNGKIGKNTQLLRVPQARVLKALYPKYLDDPPHEWPLVTRAVLGIRAGYTAISGTITRALNGIRPGSSSGDPYLGLIALKYVEIEQLDIEGVIEDNYRITHAGIKAFEQYISVNGDKLPPVKEASLCINDRYKKEE